MHWCDSKNWPCRSTPEHSSLGMTALVLTHMMAVIRYTDLMINEGMKSARPMLLMPGQVPSPRLGSQHSKPDKVAKKPQP